MMLERSTCHSSRVTLLFFETIGKENTAPARSGPPGLHSSGSGRRVIKHRFCLSHKLRQLAVVVMMMMMMMMMPVPAVCLEVP